MKLKLLLLTVLLLLAGIAGYVLSKASLVGRVGISLFYRQYRFLKVWWQGGLVVFSVWLLLFWLQGRAHRRWTAPANRWLQVVCLLVAIAGIFLTYQDFRHTLSHRWLGERFHLGGYLFWLGWMLISLFYLTTKKSGRMAGSVYNADNIAPGSVQQG